ncbi:hypothetical protein [Gloeobacter morelensis]|uniref:Uncharacterized protein n=1 Tax=Gloeobacter morelensis MG652769 TaxID=2781736 RepID=A0ABY3PRV7_9CYAN|nr:hypothetical protein [Gloeobacter morelensis]UFP96470.1 hypothetical protein ISF26_09760 [Gloeobacter morelensis MG652769]
MGLIPIGNLLSGIAAGYIGAPLTLTLGAGVVFIYALQAFWRHRQLLVLP